AVTVGGVAHQDQARLLADLHAIPAIVAAIASLPPAHGAASFHRSFATFSIIDREAFLGSASLRRASKRSPASATVAASSDTRPPVTSSMNTMLPPALRPAMTNAPSNPLRPP